MGWREDIEERLGIIKIELLDCGGDGKQRVNTLNPYYGMQRPSSSWTFIKTKEEIINDAFNYIFKRR